MCVHSILIRTFKNVLTNSAWAFLVPLRLGGGGGGGSKVAAPISTF